MKPYYQDDVAGITIYHADCRDVLPALDAVDHIITDPPYEAEAHTLGRRQRSAGVVAERPLGFDAIDEITRCGVGSEFARLSRGWILVFCQVEAAMLWRDALAPARYMRTQIWRKPDAAPQFTGDRPGMGYESIVTAWAGEGRSRWNGGGQHGVYEHGTNSDRRTAGLHPTQKPLPLMKELIALFTDPGDLILDPFGGSMTTAVAAYELGRRCIAIEREEKYCEIGVKRLAQMPLPLEVEAPPKRHSSQLAGGFEWMHTVGAGWLEEETA